jgi:hypothetical protein
MKGNQWGSSRALRRFMPDSEGGAVLWVSLVIPSVWTMLGLIEGQVASVPGFCVYSPADQVIVESDFGVVTAARIIQA